MTERVVLGVVACAVVAGCAGELRNVSAGHLGCPPEEIVISNERSGWASGSWQASCRGRTYQCSEASGKTSLQVNCTEMKPALAGSVSEVPAPPPPAPPLRRLSLTISPLYLFYPAALVTGEVRAGQKVGVAVLGAVGVHHQKTIWLTGGQLRFYPIGTFDHGAQLGAEVLYDQSWSTHGVAVGPFAGYKYTARVGLTLVAQLGVARQWRSEDPNAFLGQPEPDQWIPLVTLDAGWSF